MTTTAAANTSAAGPQGALAEILGAVTRTKIGAFAHVKAKLDAAYAVTLAAADKARVAAGPVAELRALVDGVKDLAIAQTPCHPDAKVHLPRVVRALEAGSASEAGEALSAAEFWVSEVRAEIAQGQRRVAAAFLFGKVLEEHARAKEADAPVDNEDAVIVMAADVDADAARSAAKYAEDRAATVAEFCARVFDAPALPADRSVDAFKAYVRDQVFRFDEPAHTEFLASLQRETREFGEGLAETDIDADDVRHTIAGLLSVDLLDNDRAEALRKVANDKVVHAELAAVLKMHLTDLATWSWPEQGVRVDFRRQLNGKFRAFMDEDIVTALFLQFIGTKWAVHLRGIFSRIHSSLLWTSDEDRAARVLRGDSVHSRPSAGAYMTVAKVRRDFVDKHMFAQLPKSFESAPAKYDDDGDCDRKASNGRTSDAQDAVKLKQALLHMIAADARLHRAIQPDDSPFLVARTDFEWFGPSLPHAHLEELLAFLGMPRVWIGFMMRFLATPLLVDGKLRVRTRGVPISHMLSTMLGEAIMFVLDYAVVRAAGEKATFLRMHDDIWLWGSDVAAVQAAWAEVTKFTHLAGLGLNLSKTGSLFMVKDPDSVAAVTAGKAAVAQLPSGTIAWGFLELDARSGSWVVNTSSLEQHAAELRARLASAASTLAWINAYNKYTSFVVRNCGAPVERIEHPAMLGDALHKFHALVFSDDMGSPVQALRRARLAKFADDVELGIVAFDGWLHWPLTAGGLGLLNPFAELGLLRASAEEDKDGEPEKNIRSAEYVARVLATADREKYAAAKRNHEDEYRRKKLGAALTSDADGGVTAAAELIKKLQYPPFPTMDDWLRTRRITELYHWGAWHVQLCQFAEANKSEYRLSRDLKARLSELRSAGVSEFGKGAVHNMSEQWFAVLSTYGESIAKAFGALVFVPADVVPLSMVAATRREKITWAEEPKPSGKPKAEFVESGILDSV